MKKTILGLMPLMVTSMLLAGCGSKKESSAPSSSEAPSSSSSEAPQSHTAAEVIWEIDQNLFADEAEEADIATVEQQGITFYRIVYVVNFSDVNYSQDTDATEAFLNAAFDDEILNGEVLPSYLSMSGSPVFEESSQPMSETDYVNSSRAFYFTPLKDVAVAVTSYIYALPGAEGPVVYSFYAYDVPAQA